MAQANLELGVLQETKFIDGICTHESAGYNIIVMNTTIRHCGGVAVFYHAPPRFSVKALQKFGLNNVRFNLVTGD